MEQCKIVNMYDLNETIAKEYMETAEYPWELLDGLSDYIKRLGATLDPEKYEKRGEDVWVAKNAKVAPTAFLGSPLIIDEEAEVRHCAFIRGSAIVGKGAVVGNSTELKNVILFNKVQVPHYNYVGDSILGYKAHMGAGSKFGAMLGNNVEVGCNSVLNPGTVICPESNVYPLSAVRGVVPAHSIYKNRNEIVEKQ